MTEDEIRANVQRGVAWLDKNQPEWRSGINTSRLDMVSCGRCVLGQLFGEFWSAVDLKTKAVDTSARPTEPYVLAWNQAIDLGFALPDDVTNANSDDDYAALTDMWLEVLA